MTHLRHVNILNHSRIADVELDVRDHLILVGPNDSGKSSILRCLDLLLGSSVSQLYSRMTAADFRNPDQPLVIEALFSDISNADKALFPLEIHVDSATQDLSLLIRLKAEAALDGTLSINRTAPDGGTRLQLSQAQLQGIGWKLLNANSSTRELRDDRRSAVDEILTTLDLGDERNLFTEQIEALQTLLNKSGTLNDLKKKLSIQLTRALPQPVTQDDLAFMTGASTDDDPLDGVRLRVRSEDTTKSLSEQSDGVKAMYAIALYDLISETANIVAIDEPEVHLHPASQRSLARLLNNNKNQRVLATHSPDILGAFPADCVASIQRDGSVKQPPKGFQTVQDREAVRWWVPNRLEPLTSAHVIAVEGISDRIVVQATAEAIGRNLDQHGVSLVELGGGGDAGPIHRLFGPSGFDLPLSILIDKDYEQKTASAIGVSCADLPAHGVWVEPVDLEHEYVTALGADPCWQAIQASGLFSSNELANCEAHDPSIPATVTNIAAFCRRKSDYKVRAAMAIARLINATIAVAMPTVHGLVIKATS